MYILSAIFLVYDYPIPNPKVGDILCRLSIHSLYNKQCGVLTTIRVICTAGKINYI